MVIGKVGLSLPLEEVVMGIIFSAWRVLAGKKKLLVHSFFSE